MISRAIWPRALRLNNMLLNQKHIRSFLPKRPRVSHKGTFGRVLIIAGSAQMAGAAVLCARSALQTGAGLVCLALPASRRCVAAAAVPESLTLGLPEKNGVISLGATRVLQAFIKQFKPSVILMGPGLSNAPFIIPFLKKNTLPAVLDADALNALARQKHWEKIIANRFVLICTPHPGELERLTGESPSSSQTVRMKQARELSLRSSGVTVLKGFRSVITDGKTVYINPTGGPALAKAGSGDVLGGMIAGLWAQLGTAQGFNKVSALKAAAAGVYLHGLCGDLAAKVLTDRAVLAGDVAEQLPNAWKRVLRSR